jgi:hypothetical protein
MDQQAPTSQSFQSLVASVNMQDIFQKLGVEGVSDGDKKQVAKKVADILLGRVFTRVATILTKEDVDTFTKLDAADPTGEAGKQHLLSKVPGLEAIIKEEAQYLAEDITGASTPSV